MKKINIPKSIRRFEEHLTLNNIVLGIAILIGAGWFWSSLGMMERNYALQKQLDDKEKQLIVTQLDLELAQLEQRYFRTDEFQELAVRERLGLVRPGERMLIIPPYTPKPSEDSTAESTSPNTAPSNFQQWLDFLLGSNSRSMR
jgi:hypothetical protein